MIISEWELRGWLRSIDFLIEECHCVPLIEFGNLRDLNRSGQNIVGVGGFGIGKSWKFYLVTECINVSVSVEII